MILGMIRRSGLVVFLVCLACAPRVDDAIRAPETAFIRTMPHPGGCYVQVWDQPRYAGRFDYINGPHPYASLRDMPGRLNWERRIASVRVGPAALATAFTGPNFGGTSFQLSERAEHPALPESVSRRIASLRIHCVAAADAER